jgi:hypothetical protein
MEHRIGLVFATLSRVAINLSICIVYLLNQLLKEVEQKCGGRVGWLCREEVVKAFGGAFWLG